MKNNFSDAKQSLFKSLLNDAKRSVFDPFLSLYYIFQDLLFESFNLLFGMKNSILHGDLYEV